MADPTSRYRTLPSSGVDGPYRTSDAWGFPSVIPSPAGDRCPICLERVGGVMDGREIPSAFIHTPTMTKTYQPCGCETMTSTAPTSPSATVVVNAPDVIRGPEALKAAIEAAERQPTWKRPWPRG